VLKFTEIYRAYTRENIVDLLYRTLEELKVKRKVLTITIDNTSNNELLILELFFNLKENLYYPKIAIKEIEILRF
jgi:hypothetical protein